MKRNIVIGSRESRLAMLQSEIVKTYIEKNHPEVSVSLLTMKTTGDVILDRTLDQVGGKGLFVKELDRALLDGRSDLSVHSLKDVPMEVPEELPLIAFSEREDPRDVLVLPEGCSEPDISKPIGCASPRRILQLKEIFPGYVFETVRGNVITRLKKLDDGEYGALVLAAAGLKRLGLENRISRYFDPEEIIPAAGQGILAVQGRKGEDYSYLTGFGDRDSALTAAAERSFVTALQGGCSSPIAAHGIIRGGEMKLMGLYFDEETGKYARGEITGPAGEGAALGEKLASELKEKVKNMNEGKVWLVGAGPGDLGLFTLKGMDVLRKADVVVYDSLVGQSVLSRIPESAVTIDVGKRASHHTMKQEQINQLLADQAKKGLRVVRLKGGDPFLFGRGGEEAELLAKEGIPYEVVPGVTAAVAVPAYNGIPVTHRDFCSSVHIITGHKREGMEYDIDFEALVRTKGTLVFLMGVTALPDICRGLLDGGMDPDMPAAVLQKGTTAAQKRIVATVSTLAAEAERQGVETPAVIVVGKVCSLAEEFAWYEKLPLMGKKILLTRPQNRPSAMAEDLRELGAEVVEIPAIRTVPLEDQSSLKAALSKVSRYQWLVFTSAYGVQVFFDVMREERMDIRSLGNIKVAAVGSATGKALEDKGILVDFLPETSDGMTLGQSLAQKCLENGESSLLLPRAESGSSDIVRQLEESGLAVDDIPVYRTENTAAAMKDREKFFDAGLGDCVVFTSASAVRSFAGAAPSDDFSKIKAACIGRQTEKAAKEFGMETYVSEKATLESLTELVCDLVQQGII